VSEKKLQETVEDGEGIQKIIFTSDGQALWQHIIKRKLEGVMAKREDSAYHAGKRSNLWLKIKYLKIIDCVIV